VADLLHDAGIGTLLLDLLTPDEATDRRLASDIDLLARRLRGAADRVLDRPGAHDARVGYLGIGTGTGGDAVVAAATDRADTVAAVVSAAGRPDLVGRRLTRVATPTLLVVGGEDGVVLDGNRVAVGALAGPAELAVVEGASHGFEEPGALTELALLARDWFDRYLLDDDAAA